ncbi:RHS repeat-associated core domain-containing protein [Butyrivibrio sp. M55]|nr:RHS repeat-associated core domain-containing protein [Butyrivibrio sp. M55]
MPGGNLESMTSTDKQGVLDKYFYSYDNSGLITGIDRNRRGLDKVSGRYEYSYDAIGRLTKTTHDGITKAYYEYDAFGNRTSMSETDTKTSYTYDVLDRLVEAKELNNSQAILKTYDYDKRGNQTKEFIDGLLQKTFTFDATNMLSKVVDKDKGELENHYNGLGFRVASIRPEEKIEYLCDLSKDYYNLLERTVNGETESFVYDNNVISMSKSGNNYYYLQDELGSPMYMTGTDGVAVSSYAFDDFGRNIDPFTGKQKKHGYTKQGNIIQPFAFTGYQEDEVSGLKFAQARYYSADNGRFQSEDKVKGFKDSPFTINHYGYCWGNPVGVVDSNGNLPNWAAKTTQKFNNWVDDKKKNYNRWEEIGFNSYASNNTNISSGCLAGTTNMAGTPKAESDYVGAVYLLSGDGAVWQGHAAIALVKEDGQCDVFSIGGGVDPTPNGLISGWLGTTIDDNGNQKSMSYETLVNDNYIIHDTYNNRSGNVNDPYTNFVYIPINNEQGELMYAEAMKQRAKYQNDKVAYHVLANNCNQCVQTILAAANLDFAPNKFDWFGTAPNVTYNRIVDSIKRGEHPGWYYGFMTDLEDAYANECG